jgi:hypothetical protein
MAIQAAIKNLATNAVFYFAIPVSMEAVFTAGGAMDVNSLAAAWKSIEESNEVSAVVNGTNCWTQHIILQCYIWSNHYIT